MELTLFSQTTNRFLMAGTAACVLGVGYLERGSEKMKSELVFRSIGVAITALSALALSYAKVQTGGLKGGALFGAIFAVVHMRMVWAASKHFAPKVDKWLRQGEITPRVGEAHEQNIKHKANLISAHAMALLATPLACLAANRCGVNISLKVAVLLRACTMTTSYFLTRI